ncbi:MAG: NAD(P) transhydrogenase subunit alpha [Francisellaceae bacterium]|jgi:NAD(P) transhydrogenase subunit alpha
MQIGIPVEVLLGETRVAATPESVKNIIKLGFDVMVQSGAGRKAYFSDQLYQDAGAIISNDVAQVFSADIILKVNAPIVNLDLKIDETKLFSPGSTLICFLWPAQNAELLAQLAKRKINVMAMDCVPRISRSQSLDALSSMANISGYRAVIESAHSFGRLLGGQITAAGRIPPAKVLVIGAGVAGLSAIGAAGNMGAIVRSFDTRPEVKEQIHSLGAEFLEVNIVEESGSGDGYAKVMSKAYIEAEMLLFAKQAKDVDIIITTALIPGKPAPKLITKDMVYSMKPGSIIIDLAAQNGGNCELCKPGEVFVTDNNVKIIGYTDLPGRLPAQSSQLYATNLLNLLKLLTPEKNGQIAINFEDVVIRGVTVIKTGEITWPAPPIKTSAAPKASSEAENTSDQTANKPKGLKRIIQSIAVLAVAGLIALIAAYTPPSFLGHFTVFILACIIGYYVVWNVAHSLHTPLMSVTNAISGIIVVGALLQLGHAGWIVSILAFIATLIASVNIAGGFFVTKRMLKMFKK